MNYQSYVLAINLLNTKDKQTMRHIKLMCWLKYMLTGKQCLNCLMLKWEKF